MNPMATRVCSSLDEEVQVQSEATSGLKGTTWVHTYDQGGNILSKAAYPFTEEEAITGAAVHADIYTYGNANWKDQLTAYNGTPITYDAIGNPLTFGTQTFTWQHGRQLAQTSKDGETVSFVYNEDGLRVQKTATSTGTTMYTLHGKNIVHLTNGNDELHFFYDAQDRVAVVEYNGTPYRYVHNLQGDVVALVDGNGQKVVEYWYDAWGKPISKIGTLAETLGTVQPFRYRGYVFDEETGLYYLRNRYYRSDWCRFFSCDSLFSNIENSYTYCYSDPILFTDPSGNIPEEEWASIKYNTMYMSTTSTTGLAYDHSYGPIEVLRGTEIRVFLDGEGNLRGSLWCYAKGLTQDWVELQVQIVDNSCITENFTEAYFGMHGIDSYYNYKSKDVWKVIEGIELYTRAQTNWEFSWPLELSHSGNVYKKAIEYIQNEIGVTVDGKAGKDTLYALSEHIKSIKPYSYGKPSHSITEYPHHMGR